MNFLIKQVDEDKLGDGFSLIWRTFSEFVAPDYTKEAVNNFKKNFIDNPNYKDAYICGNEIMYGAYIEGELAGVLSIRGGDFISCAFVDKKYHRKGIAGELFKNIIPILKNNGVKKIRLNSSPYAVPFYHSIGFKDLGNQQVYEGIKFTPMELVFK